MPYCPHGKHKGGEGRRGERSAGRPEVVRPRGKGKPLASAHEVRQGRMRGVQVRQGASHVDIRVPRRGQAQVLYRFRKTRAGSVPAGVFGGRRPHGVLVTDRYTGYDRPWRGDRQYCYAHILRKLLRLPKKEPDNKEYRAFVPPMAEQLRAAMKLRSRGLPPGDFAREAEAVKSRIVELANRSAKDPALQNVQNIFREHADRMYHWARGPDIPAENNRAERGVRGLVIARKTSFGGSPRGSSGYARSTSPSWRRWRCAARTRPRSLRRPSTSTPQRERNQPCATSSSQEPGGWTVRSVRRSGSGAPLPTVGVSTPRCSVTHYSCATQRVMFLV